MNIEKQKKIETDKNATVYIVGPQRAQNELLSTFIKNTLSFNCKSFPKLSLLPKVFNLKNKPPHLILIDCFSKNPSNLWDDQQLTIKVKENGVFLALFNLHTNEKNIIEKEAIMSGFRGIFFSDENLDNISKGISRIIKGELWFSRDIMSDCLIDIKDKIWDSNKPNSSLTRRETEVLCLIASGCSNAEIAETLFISPHTIRTHLYNIYKKIDVPNRLHAALWAKEHLN